ncbi:MAG TPA: flagellar export chaperone FlgN [bacterium]|nr:flagellar export chaperone FlgN [bacterium]
MEASSDRIPDQDNRESASSEALQVKAALLQGFGRQLVIYRELTTLAQQLSVAISDGDHQRLLQLVAHKQERVESLALIDVSLACAKNSWAGLREQVSDGDRAEIRNCVVQIERVLKELLSLEAANEQALSILAQQTQKDVQAAQTERRARSAYNLPPAGNDPGVLDKRG